MPLIESRYRCPRFLRNGHVQTVLPALLPRWAAGWQQRERLELADGDFVDLFWRRHGGSRLAVLSHGLEGSANAVYIRGMARTLAKAGWDVLAWNFRGCGGIPNRLLRSYHSGESDDLRQVVAHAAASYEMVALMGFSLGGNITLKYLGEAPPHPKVQSAAVISTPVDLASSARALDERPSNRIYLRRFLNTLVEKMTEKAARFPGQLDVTGLHQMTTIRAFDDRFTAPLHGFLNADDYWRRASSLPWLEQIAVPTLLLSACDDPLLTEDSLPTQLAGQHPALHLEIAQGGGHVGFMNVSWHMQPWHEFRVLQFLQQRG